MYFIIFNFMKYFIHMLLWISSLALHIENHTKGFWEFIPRK